MSDITVTLVSGQTAVVGVASSREAYEIEVSSGIAGSPGVGVVSANIVGGMLNITLSNTAVINAGSVVGISTTGTVTFTDDTIGQFSNAAVKIKSGANVYSFGNTGVTFPDGTIQTTAFTGGSSNNANSALTANNALFLGGVAANQYAYANITFSQLSSNGHTFALRSNGEIAFPNGLTVSNSAPTLIANIGKDISFNTSYMQSIIATAAAGSGVNTFVIDTTGNTSVFAIQPGWTVQIGQTVYTINSATRIDGNHTYTLNIPGFTFPQGASLFFRNPNPVASAWAFSNNGGLVFPDSTTQTTAFTKNYDALTVGFPRFPRSTATNAIHAVDLSNTNNDYHGITIYDTNDGRIKTFADSSWHTYATTDDVANVTVDRLTNNGYNVTLSDTGTLTTSGNVTFATTNTGSNTSVKVAVHWDDPGASPAVSHVTSEWTFEHGGLTFPDNTVQTTAFTGALTTDSLVSGSNTVTLQGNGQISLPTYTVNADVYTTGSIEVGNSHIAFNLYPTDPYTAPPAANSTTKVVQEGIEVPTSVSFTNGGYLTMDPVTARLSSNGSIVLWSNNGVGSWTFASSNAGVNTLTFPDDTVQTTAFTGSYDQLSGGFVRVPHYASATNIYADLHQDMSRDGIVFINEGTSTLNYWSSTSNGFISVATSGSITSANLSYDQLTTGFPRVPASQATNAIHAISISNNTTAFGATIYDTGDNRVKTYISPSNGWFTYATTTDLTSYAPLANPTFTGNITGNTGGFEIGYKDVPQNYTNTSFTIGMSDRGKHIYTSNGTSQTITIANNATVAFPIGTAISIVSQGAGTITVARGSGVSLYLAANNTSADRTLSSYGMATLLKVATDTWFISGAGVA